MKTTITLFFLLLYGPPAMAGEWDCSAFALKAEKVMIARQLGVKVGTPDNEMERDMMMNSWGWPKYHGEKMQSMVVRLFVTDWLEVCHNDWYGVMR